MNGADVARTMLFDAIGEQAAMLESFAICLGEAASPQQRSAVIARAYARQIVAAARALEDMAARLEGRADG